jgi:hypothetical protein
MRARAMAERPERLRTDTRTVTVVLKGTDMEFIGLLDALELAGDESATVLRSALCRTIGLVEEGPANAEA